jgi:hypothetical protein
MLVANRYGVPETYRGTHPMFPRTFLLLVAHLNECLAHALGEAAWQPVSRDLPRVRVAGNVTTQGGESNSLVKGKVMNHKAYAVSVQKEGHIGELSVGGALRTEG